MSCKAFKISRFFLDEPGLIRVNSNPGGIGRNKTSKQVKIHCKVVMRRKNMKKLCNPHLSSTEYFVLSPFRAKSPFYTIFFNTSEDKSDSGRLISLPQEAIWMMQKLKKCLMLCMWDGCKAVWTSPLHLAGLLLQTPAKNSQPVWQNEFFMICCHKIAKVSCFVKMIEILPKENFKIILFTVLK